MGLVSIDFAEILWNAPTCTGVKAHLISSEIYCVPLLPIMPVQHYQGAFGSKDRGQKASDSNCACAGEQWFVDHEVQQEAAGDNAGGMLVAGLL